VIKTQVPMLDAAVSFLPPPVVTNNKRVLLVDAEPAQRALRMRTMTRMGMDVCCATDAAQARMLARESPYDLILINLPRDRQAALKLSTEMKEDRPEQPVVFYVGRPSYLAATPLPENESPNKGPGNPVKEFHAVIEKTCTVLPGRGRLLEAAWRMCLLRRSRSANGAQSSFGAAIRLAEREEPRG